MPTGQMLDVGALLLSYSRTAQVFNFNFSARTTATFSSIVRNKLCYKFEFMSCQHMRYPAVVTSIQARSPFHFRADRTNFCQPH